MCSQQSLGFAIKKNNHEGANQEGSAGCGQDGSVGCKSARMGAAATGAFSLLTSERDNTKVAALSWGWGDCGILYSDRCGSQLGPSSFTSV